MERYCIVLQRKYRKNYLVNTLKGILESVKSCQNSYQFMKTISKKSLITNMKNVLDYSQNILKYIDSDIEQFNTNIKNVKQILIIFAFVKFPVIFLSNNTQYNEKIIDYSSKLNDLLDKMVALHSPNFFVYLYAFIREIPLYLECYNDWETIDKQVSTCHLLLTYHKNSEKKKNLKNTSLDKITKDYIDKEQISLESNVKYMNDNKALQYFINHKNDENSDQVYEELYWIDVKYKLTKKSPSVKDKLILVDLFNKTIILLKNCVPNRDDIHREIEGKIDLTIIKQLIENEIKDDDLFFDLIQYILQKLSQFQARANDQENAIWMNKLKTSLLNNVYYQNFIPQFFQQLFEKLKKIIDDCNTFKNFLSKNGIKKI